MTHFVFIIEKRINFSVVSYKLNFTVFANISNLFIKDFKNFSLAGANGSLIKHSFLSPNNHCGINT